MVAKSKSLVEVVTTLTEFLARFDAEVSEKLDLSSKDNLQQCLENTRVGVLHTFIFNCVVFLQLYSLDLQST